MVRCGGERFGNGKSEQMEMYSSRWRKCHEVIIAVKALKK